MSTVLSHPTLDATIERLTSEGLIGLREASAILKRHAATLARWVLDGVTLPDGRVVKLEGFRLGGKIQTSRAALFRFAAAQQATSDGPAPIATPAVRRRADAQAERILDAAGIR